MIYFYQCARADRSNSDVVGISKPPKGPTVYPPDEDYEHICAIYLDRFQPIWPILKVADVHATRRPRCVKDIIFRQVCDALKSIVGHKGCIKAHKSETNSTTQLPCTLKYDDKSRCAGRIPCLEAVAPRSLGHLERTCSANEVSKAISIATCVEPSASKYLRLEPGGPVLPFPEFQRPLAKSALSFLDEQVLADRTDHIRALFLLFFYQPARASELDMPSLIFSQAMHYAVSIGIHLVGSGAQDERSKEAETLYCALWALDRMNAAFHGRPCLLHDRDTDRDLDECIAAQEEPGFRLLLSVCIMLDKVICLYRPRSKGDETVVLPVFESMIMDAGADKAAPWIHCKSCLPLQGIGIHQGYQMLSSRQKYRNTVGLTPDQFGNQRASKYSTTQFRSSLADNHPAPSPHRLQTKRTSPTQTSTPAAHYPQTA